jgi:hypothetical protein
MAVSGKGLQKGMLRQLIDVYGSQARNPKSNKVFNGYIDLDKSAWVKGRTDVFILPDGTKFQASREDMVNIGNGNLPKELTDRLRKIDLSKVNAFLYGTGGKGEDGVKWHHDPTEYKEDGDWWSHNELKDRETYKAGPLGLRTETHKVIKTAEQKLEDEGKFDFSVAKRPHFQEYPGKGRVTNKRSRTTYGPAGLGTERQLFKQGDKYYTTLSFIKKGGTKDQGYWFSGGKPKEISQDRFNKLARMVIDKRLKNISKAL